MYAEGVRWVVKAPFTTDGDFVKFCRSFESIISAIDAARDRFGDLIPNVMLQPTMRNRREEKVIRISGKAFHIASQSLKKKTQG